MNISVLMWHYFRWIRGYLECKTFRFTLCSRLNCKFNISRYFIRIGNFKFLRYSICVFRGNYCSKPKHILLDWINTFRNKSLGFDRIFQCRYNCLLFKYWYKIVRINPWHSTLSRQWILNSSGRINGIPSRNINC